MDDVTVTTMKFRISTSHPLYDIPYTRKCVYFTRKLSLKFAKRFEIYYIDDVMVSMKFSEPLFRKLSYYSASSSTSWLQNLTDISQIFHRNPTISKSQKFCSVIFLCTSKFWKIVCKDEKVRTRGCISSSAWYKLSFEPSTTSVRFVLWPCD